MADSYQQKLLKTAATMAARWAGATGQMYSLSAAHQTLVVLLSRGELTKNLYVACLGPTHIMGPVRWNNASILVTINQDGSAFTIEDKANGVLITCEGVEVKENVKL